MMTNDYISRSYELEQIRIAKDKGVIFDYDSLIDFVKVLPSATPIERVIIDKINQIINSSAYIQEDVIRYKMVCQLMEEYNNN